MTLRRLMLTLCVLGAFITNSAGVARADTRPEDQRITHWVEQALVDDPRVDPSDITVKTTDGIVVLAGSVRSLAAKRYADREAKKIHGVMGVVNKIQVMPAARFDTDIAQDVRHRLVNSVSLKSQGIQVSVSAGVVSLSGKVASWAERQEATLLTSEVPGVKAINNNLALAFPNTRSDADIQRDVAGVLARDVYLTGLPISATVNNGVVRLSGEVGTAYQKERAGDEVYWVAAVKGLDNQIEITGSKNMDTRRKVTAPTDAQLKAAVQDTLQVDQRLDSHAIRVAAAVGNVTLRGHVPSFHQKRIADQDARDVVGVAWVTNLLGVRGKPRADADIRKDVIAQLSTDATLAGTDMVHARIHDGIVTLVGDVDNNFERRHAADVVSRIPGVRNIVNNVMVEWSSWDTDASLRRRIREHLAADGETRWVADQIQIAVNRGIATLTGSVDFWSERNAAGRIAQRTNGVRGVDNQLSVSGYNYNWNAD